MRLFLESVGFGISAGALISLAAVGFTIQFGISNVLNISYGPTLTLSAYLGYLLVLAHVNVWLTVALIGAAMGILSVLYNRLFITPLSHRGGGFVGVIIGTVGAGIIIQFAITLIAGPSTFSYGRQAWRSVFFLDMVFSVTQIILIGIAVVAMIVYHLLLTRTQLGRGMRATANNAMLAQACGIRTQRIIDFAWLISGFLCGGGGVALAITTVSFDFSLGTTFLIYVIAAAVLGGIGQPYGAMLGGLVVGIGSQVAGTYTSPAYQDVVALGLLVLLLLVKPTGLFSSGTAGARTLAQG